MIDASLLGQVVLLGKREQTLDGLQYYLGATGLMSRCTTSLADLEQSLSHDSVSSLVFLADEFVDEEVLVVLDMARARSKKARFSLVILTGDPPRFESAANGDIMIVVLPKPALGRTILDALRAKDTAHGALD